MTISDRDPGDEQMSLERLWPCPACHGAQHINTPDGQEPCRVCQASGQVGYPPDDYTEIPY